VAVVALALLAGLGGVLATHLVKRPEPPESFLPGSRIPALSHVFVIVLENHDLSGVVGSPQAPYLNQLIGRFGLATAYTSIRHPSQPNYLALFSGDTQGVKDDAPHDLTAPTIADQLDAAGHSWRVVAENWPGNCATAETASDGPDGPGEYARKHNPAISFTSISRNPSRCANIVDFSRFDPAAADFQLIVPNTCHDMHSCSEATGDTFLASFVPRILNSEAWQLGGALFITWDEGPGTDTVPLIVATPKLAAGYRSSTPHTHYSLLRTIEDAWQLGCLEEACEATDLGEFFGAVPQVPRPPATLAPGSASSAAP
jgi:acid phosphatase